ncbi:MAG TPA: response regulator [Pyrinomonadaceae bacterium]|nr:response regulator [Pyrinomonadaceae bacterium]
MAENAVSCASSKMVTADALSSWKPTILIAEDSADSREMMQLLLEMKGYQVVAADDGRHALEVALSRRPDCVLLDLELPKLDGLSVTRSLRSHLEFKDVPIVILSGHDPSRFRQDALDAGCDDYLLKPINFDSLHELLDRMIGHTRRPRSFIKSA